MNACKLCRSPEHRRRYLLRAPTREEFAAVVCDGCGLFQVEYDWAAAPALKVITEFDEGTRGELWGSEEEVEAHKRKGAALSELVNESVEVKGKRILDIGCGDGYLLEALKRSGASHVTGQEFRNVDIRHARERAGIGDVRPVPFTDVGAWPSGEFDIVCSADVAEHVHDLQAFFEDCLRLVKPGGVIFHATPGFNSMSHRAGRTLARLGGRGAAATLCNVQPAGDLLGGAHVSIFGRRQVAWLAAHHGLEPLACRYVSSYTYSNAHYAALVPGLRRLPRALGTAAFALVRATVRNKLVFAMRRSAR